VGNFGLSLLAAVLQIFTTVAVVQALPPSIAGVYFKGVVICYGLAALLRGKYELFATHYFFAAPDSKFPSRDLVRGLGFRVFIRSALACALLLVVTADLDVMEPRLRPFLGTYLPFVLAVPFATVALFLASVLRSLNRYLGATLVASYSINIMVLAAANGFSGSLEDMLIVLSWAFFIGTALAALVGVLITRKIFPETSAPGRSKVESRDWREIYQSASRNGLTGITIACLQWGPLCVLALLGTEAQIAHYAAVTRTAQVIDFLIPAAILVPHAFLLHSRWSDTMRTNQGKLMVDLGVSLATTTLSVLAVAAATPWIIDRFGASYTGLTELFILLFATQWMAGVSRPAIRHLAAKWHFPQIRRILFISMIVAVALSLVLIPTYDSLGAAISVFVGTLLLNGQALQAAFAGCRRTADGELDC
jgi:O-antigen/teichoic acid export membrane protein